LVSIPYEVPYILPIDYTLEKGKGVALTKGKDAIVFAYGMVMLSELYKASKILQDKYEFGLKVVNLPWLNYIDKDWLADEIGVIKNIFTVDNHLIKGGQGQYMSNSIIDSNLNTCNIKIVNLGLKDIPLCGMNDEVLKHYRLDSNSLVNIILNQ
jgi:transketolase